MSRVKTAFFGTHEFASTILQGLINSPLFEILLVITQPDRPVGRKQKLQAPPTKLLAQKYNIPIEQPSSLKNYELKTPSSELFIVAQYGLLIPKHIIEAPRYGTINIHTSLLPKYRGASPIQSAILNGETNTGVTIMLMDEGLDSGPLLLQKQIKIFPDETYPELDARLAQIGLTTLLDAVPKYIQGKLKPTAQNETLATVCKKVSREDGKVNWDNSTQKIYNQYRALHPWPGLWTMWEDKRLKLLKIKPGVKRIEPSRVEAKDDILLIGTSDASIQVFELQIEGKPVMNVKTFLNGYQTINKQGLG